MSNTNDVTNIFLFHVLQVPSFCRSRQQISTDESVAESAVHSLDIDQHECVGVTCANYFCIKCIVDCLLAALLMVVALPLMLTVSFAILILEGRPVFYRQTRVGKNGRTFKIWKFRTMCHNAERTTGAVWSSKSDPRVTRLGRWLRCSHVDELPQLWNVLIGDMHLIGPRPERPEFVHELQSQIAHYRERLKVRPGLTGLAQLQIGYDQSVASVRTKVQVDLEYIRSASFINDQLIIVRTVSYILNTLYQTWRDDRSPVNEDARIDMPNLATQCVKGPPRELFVDKSETQDYSPPIPNLLLPLPVGNATSQSIA